MSDNAKNSKTKFTSIIKHITIMEKSLFLT